MYTGLLRNLGVSSRLNADVTPTVLLYLGPSGLQGSWFDSGHAVGWADMFRLLGLWLNTVGSDVLQSRGPKLQIP